MSTPLHIRATTMRLRRALSWLDAAGYAPAPRTPRSLLTPAARANLDRQARAERADRHAVLVSGYAPTGRTAAPGNLGAFDAMSRIAGDMNDLAWTVASHLHNHPARTPYVPAPGTGQETAVAALTWLSGNAAHLTMRHVVDDTYKRLLAAERLAGRASGAVPPPHRLRSECPACGRRAMTVDWLTSTDQDEWSISCGNRACRCSGAACPCKIPERRAGMTHLWPVSMWENLGARFAVAA